jgi:hypothetical protein
MKGERTIGFAVSDEQRRRMTFRPEALRIACNGCEKAMSLMARDMDNPEIPINMQHQARLTILAYGYGKPMSLQEAKVLHQELEREEDINIIPTPEQARLISSGAFTRLLETLDDDGTLEAYRRAKSQRKNGFLIEQETQETKDV